jgi:hypothetical protein
MSTTSVLILCPHVPDYFTSKCRLQHCWLGPHCCRTPRRGTGRARAFPTATQGFHPFITEGCYRALLYPPSLPNTTSADCIWMYLYRLQIHWENLNKKKLCIQTRKDLDSTFTFAWVHQGLGRPIHEQSLTHWTVSTAVTTETGTYYFRDRCCHLVRN